MYNSAREKQLNPSEPESNDGETPSGSLKRESRYLMKPEHKGPMVPKLVEKFEGIMLCVYFFVSVIECVSFGSRGFFFLVLNFPLHYYVFCIGKTFLTITKHKFN